MALIEAKDVAHGPLEFLFTVDEETASKLFGDDFMNYAPSTRGSVNQNVMVPVKVYLIWPQ